MPHYYSQPAMAPGSHYTPAPSYAYGYANGVTSPQAAGHPGPPVGAQVQPQSLPLPGMYTSLHAMADISTDI